MTPKERPAFKPFRFGRFDEVVLFVEKAGLFPRLKPLAKMLGFTIECGKGQQATSAIEGLVNYLQDGKEYLVFVLTDFDFYGFEIMESLKERIEILGLNAEFKRVGLWKNQIPEKKWEAKRYRLKIPSKGEKKRRRGVLEWLDQYGIKDRYGFELEAITDPRELRRLVANAVYKYCDVEKLYNHFLEKGLEYYVNIGELAWNLAYDSEEVTEIRDNLKELKGEVNEDENLKELKKKLEELKEELEELKEERRGRIKEVKEELEAEGGKKVKSKSGGAERKYETEAKYVAKGRQKMKQKIKKEEGYPTIAKTLRKAINSFIRKKEFQL